jgi:hypothetical protein
MTLSQSVLEYVQSRLVAPARSSGEPEIAVTAGQVHRDLRWTSRVPAVCAALNSRKLQRAAGIELIEKSGPPSGQSTTMRFRYRIVEQSPAPAEASKGAKNLLCLLDLYGICKEMYAEVGGGEAFIRAKRENFGSVIPETDSPSQVESER